jgi:hypothetical protein
MRPTAGPHIGPPNAASSAARRAAAFLKRVSAACGAPACHSSTARKDGTQPTAASYSQPR